MTRGDLPLFERRGTAILVLAEAFAACAGFLATARIARSLGSDGYGGFEFVAALAAWWLILVRGGFDALLVREAAKRPARLPILLSVQLIGRSAAALVGALAVLTIGWAAGRPGLAAYASLILVASALTPDLRARLEWKVGPLALAQVVRGLSLLGWSAWFVSGRGREYQAVAGLVVSEVCVALVHLRWSAQPARLTIARAWRMVRLRWGRSLAASVARFGRVTLYALDPILLGLWHDPELGPYAAARRLTFALLGLALVIPTTAAGPLAAAISRGAKQGTDVLERGLTLILLLTLPPTLGLILTADGWMPRLFGPEYRAAGPLLALLVVRVPILAISAFIQTVLVAAGRDRFAGRLMANQVAVALAAGSLGYAIAGLWGLAWSVLVVEVVGLACGWQALRDRSIALPRLREYRWPKGLASGLIGIVAGCLLAKGSSVEIRSFLGVLGFVLAWSASRIPWRTPVGLEASS